VARGWTDAQRRAYAIADNQLALNSGWDEELLRLEIGELQDEGEIDLSLTGLNKALLGSKASTAKMLKDEYNYSVIVDCEDETQQRELIEQFEAEGLKCRIL